MSKIIIVAYFCVFIIILIIYLKNYLTIGNFEKKSNSVNDYFEIINQINVYRTKLAENSIAIQRGKVFYYDISNNTINIKVKKQYTEYDVFVYSHEIGHSIEFYYHKAIYRLIYNLNILINILYILNVSANTIMIINEIHSTCVLVLCNCVAIVLFIIKFSSIYWIENGASMQALKLFSKMGYDGKNYDKIIKLSIINQYVFCFIQFIPLVMTFAFTLY